jgi:hypothetical protein
VAELIRSGRLLTFMIFDQLTGEIHYFLFMLTTP